MTSVIEMLPLPTPNGDYTNPYDGDDLENYGRAMAEHNVRSLTHELANAECVIDAEQAGRKKAEARAKQLTETLRLARDLVEDWASYASEYFQKKHNLEGDLALLDAALHEHDQEKDNAQRK